MLRKGEITTAFMPFVLIISMAEDHAPVLVSSAGGGFLLITEVDNVAPKIEDAATASGRGVRRDRVVIYMHRVQPAKSVRRDIIATLYTRVFDRQQGKKSSSAVAGMRNAGGGCGCNATRV